jgi:hypothetical protein
VGRLALRDHRARLAGRLIHRILSRHDVQVGVRDFSMFCKEGEDIQLLELAWTTRESRRADLSTTSAASRSGGMHKLEAHPSDTQSPCAPLVSWQTRLQQHGTDGAKRVGWFVALLHSSIIE